MIPWFGKVKDGKMVLYNIGNIVQDLWLEIDKHFNFVRLDEFIVMPNHIHGIIEILNVETRHAVSLPEHINNFGPLAKGSLSTIIGSYKSAVTRTIRNQHNSKFAWQPRFWDHIIKNDTSYENIIYYIRSNPQNWEQDRNILNEDKQFIKHLKKK